MQEAAFDMVTDFSGIPVRTEVTWVYGGQEVRRFLHSSSNTHYFLLTERNLLNRCQGTGFLEVTVQLVLMVSAGEHVALAAGAYLSAVY